MFRLQTTSLRISRVLSTSIKMNPATRNPGRNARGGYRGKKPMSSITAQPPRPPPQGPPRVSTPPLTEAVPEDTMRFADLGKDNLLHPIILQTILQDLKFDHMMPVQAATLHDLLEKRIDCLAQAKTGTGKTIAFLLPAIQTLINRNRAPKSGISLLVLSPTRELAMQIAKEATALLQRLPQFKVSFAIGGTNKDREERDILKGCDILIGTPGRLFDHLSNPQVVNAFRTLDTLVLDEADRLLDMGFMPQLQKIISCLPDKNKSERQGMLFSATIAPHVQKFAHLVLSDGYKFISTIKEGEVQTHERVPQLLVTVPEFADVAPAMVASIRAECTLAGAANFKTIVFAPTAALADFYGDILSKVGGLPEVQILHSRMTQSKRTKTTAAFKDASSMILVATDVVARGMDFPNVSNIFQVGLPADKESYIHRLGRTARAGREGRSMFIVTQDETFFPKWTLKEITFEAVPADLSSRAQVQTVINRYDNKAKVYQAWLGYYKSHVKAMKWTEEILVAQANKFALEGMETGEVPGIQKSTVGKMGLKGVRGLNVVPNEPHVGRNGGGGRGGGGEGRSAGSGGRGGVAPPATRQTFGDANGGGGGQRSERGEPYPARNGGGRGGNSSGRGGRGGRGGFGGGRGGDNN